MFPRALILWFLARFRLSDWAICKLSKGQGLIDWHDYPDSVEGLPNPFTVLTCKRCGKKFLM